MHDKFREGLLEHKMLDLVSETTCRLSRHSFELWQAVKKINVNIFLKKKQYLFLNYHGISKFHNSCVSWRSKLHFSRPNWQRIAGNCPCPIDTCLSICCNFHPKRKSQNERTCDDAMEFRS